MSCRGLNEGKLRADVQEGLSSGNLSQLQGLMNIQGSDCGFNENSAAAVRKQAQNQITAVLINQQKEESEKLLNKTINSFRDEFNRVQEVFKSNEEQKKIDNDSQIESINQATLNSEKQLDTFLETAKIKFDVIKSDSQKSTFVDVIKVAAIIGGVLVLGK